jgi:hypothetical protein
MCTAKEILEDIGELPGTFMPDTRAWREAFEYYNEMSGMPPLSTGCRPCYHKVYQFLKVRVRLLETSNNGQQHH